MKKIYFLFFLVLNGLALHANPIVMPVIKISELFFDESGNWKLELDYNEVSQKALKIDSVFLSSTSHTVKLPSYDFSESAGILVLTADSLDSDFQINKLGDAVTVVTYLMGTSLEDKWVFGNLQGSVVGIPRQGQSISKYWVLISKDNSPTIGLPNDTLGMCGTVKGIVYDLYSEPVKNRTFFMDNYFSTSEDGTYSVRVYSRLAAYNLIACKIGPYSTKSVTMDKVSYAMEPDSVVELDIHLRGELPTGFHEVNKPDFPVSVSPNPISKDEELTVIIDLPIIACDIFMEMVDIHGKVVRKMKMNQNVNLIAAPDESGLYIVRFLIDSEIISSHKIIVNE